MVVKRMPDVGRSNTGRKWRHEFANVEEAVPAANDQRSGQPGDTDRVIWDMLQSGVSGSHIAAIFGVSKHEIYRRLNKFPAYKEFRETERKRRNLIEKEIIDALSDGLPSNEIIDTLGMSRSAFDSWAHRRGIAISRPKESHAFDVDEAWRMLRRGASTREIADHFRTYRVAVTRALKNKNLEEYKRIVSSRRGGRSAGTLIGNTWDVERAFLEYKEGASTYDIALKYGKHQKTIVPAFRKKYGKEYTDLAAEKLIAHRSGLGNRRRVASRRDRLGE